MKSKEKKAEKESKHDFKEVYRWERTIIDELIKEGKISVDTATGRLLLAIYTYSDDGGYTIESIPLTVELVDQIEREKRYCGMGSNK